MILIPKEGGGFRRISETQARTWTAPDGSGPYDLLDHERQAQFDVVELPEPDRPDGRFYEVEERFTAATIDGPWVTVRERSVESLEPDVLSQIKRIRQQTLDTFTKSPGVAAIYNENLLAAQRYQASDPTAMRDGQTPEQYLSAMATKMGVPLATFVAYILAENMAAAQKAAAVECIYLDYAYVKLKAATFDGMKTILAEYQAEIAAVLA